jgi:hypothetical protein
MKASLWGAPNGSAKCFWMLGRYRHETFLKSACLGWLCQTLCSYAGYLDVSTLHAFIIIIFLRLHHRPTPDIATSATTTSTTSSYDAPFNILQGILGYWTLLIEASSRSAHRQGLLEVDLARLLAAMLGDLGVSTLRFIKTMTQFSSLLSIKLAMLPTSMLGDYSTSASSTPSCFPHHTDLLGNPFLITSLLDLLFLLFFFFGSLYQPSCPP